MEFHIGEHASSYLHLTDGSRLYEPPGVEGFVERVRAGGGKMARQAVCLSTHDGLLFVLPPGYAHPPHPPGTMAPPPPGNDAARTLREQEIRRGAAQVLSARGVTDLRNVIAVRRAEEIIPRSSVDPASVLQWMDEAGAGLEARPRPLAREAGDEEDAGGANGLQVAGSDPATMRMKRSFELVMQTGRVVRFEVRVVLSHHHERSLTSCLQTHSCKLAIEWIEHLRALVRYWRKRNVVDAQLAMDVVHAATGRPRVTPHRKWHDEGQQPPADSTMNAASAVLPYLSHVYNWCVLDGCRPITKTGRVFMRKGIHGQYKYVSRRLATWSCIRSRCQEC